MRANVVRSRTDESSSASVQELCNVPCFKGSLVRKLRAGMPDGSTLEALAVLFGCLADRTRLRILHALSDGEELCVCDVAHVLGMSVSAASHHLRKLRDLGILKNRGDGKMTYYAVAQPLAVKLLDQALRAKGGGR